MATVDEDAVPGPPPSERGKSRWRPFSGLRDKVNIQDRLLDSLLSQVLSPDDNEGQDATRVAAPDGPADSSRPNFNISTMSTNFRRFNARIGVVFHFQARLLDVLSWKRPAPTISLLAVYTLVCLDPYLLSVVPLAVLLLGVLIPAFMARHPNDEAEMGFDIQGPPRAPAKTVKPVKELSRDFFKNMRDLQNSMEDFSRGHDQVVQNVLPYTNFSDEVLSSGIFLGACACAAFMSMAAHLLPWKLISLCAGWAFILSKQPSISRLMQRGQQQLGLDEKGDRAQGSLESWIRRDIILDHAPETREVEVFELQRRTEPEPNGEWEAWLFSPSPYDPLSHARIAGDRPKGARYFEDVQAPEGWEWSEKKWVLDLWSREWVEERIITGVEVETEGERWVYDMFEERTATIDADITDGLRSEHLQPQSNLWAKRPQASRHVASWEEGDDSESQRGEWRRRRWVRLVKRRMAALSGS